MIGGHDICCRYVCVCQIAFQSVPFGIFQYSVVVDADGRAAIHVEKLVVSPTVDVFLAKMSCLVGFLQSANALVAIMNVLQCAFFAKAYEQATPSPFVYLMQYAVHFGKGQDLPFHLLRFILDAAAYYILAAIGFQGQRQ